MNIVSHIIDGFVIECIDISQPVNMRLYRIPLGRNAAFYP